MYFTDLESKRYHVILHWVPFEHHMSAESICINSNTFTYSVQMGNIAGSIEQELNSSVVMLLHTSELLVILYILHLQNFD